MNSPPVQTDSSHLAMDRTWLSHERTLMAWVRTATSMISFGFTIYKFFQYQAGPRSPAARAFVTPRDFSLVMISIGLVALLMATIAHRKETRGLSESLNGRRSRAQIVAGLVSIFGLSVFLATIFRG
jgi:putative membrane protein